MLRPHRSTAAVLALLAAAPIAADDARPEALRGHPVITEVLFNVPKGEAGDANADGLRHATGDEFVEIANPTDRPLRLTGYTLTNRLTTGDPDTKRGVRFTFPDLTLPPGSVAVVFNGCESEIPGPVGTSDAPPAAPNPRFAGALVLSMGNGSRNRALANGGDFVLLSAPDGAPIDAVWWGACDPMPPERTLRVAEAARSPKGSVQRGPHANELTPHPDLDGAPSSPGELP
jgi:hypothetical protein